MGYTSTISRLRTVKRQPELDSAHKTKGLVKAIIRSASLHAHVLPSRIDAADVMRPEQSAAGTSCVDDET